jgi:hypothetical protein
VKRPAVVASALAAVVLSVAAPAAAQMPDPATTGPNQVDKLVYSAGSITVTDPNGRNEATQRLRGNIHAPTTGGNLPVLLFMHGRHNSCETADMDGVSIFTCPPPDDAISNEDRSYEGYDYIAANLASHGYLVMSVDTNDINDWDGGSDDAGIHARAQLVGESLDLLAAWNTGSGPAPVGSKLTGRLDMARIGLMGHSRGGEGVAEYIDYDKVRTDGPAHAVDAVFALAPIDFNAQKPVGVPFATMLPYCDGDVFDLEGAFMWERAKRENSEAGFPHIQWSVNSANHNYFNTQWELDDAVLLNFGDPHCVVDRSPTRLTAAEQKSVGLGYIAGFMRRYVGGETAFEPLMTGAQRPASTCPAASPAPIRPTCDNVVMTSYVAPAASRRLVIEPGATNPLTVNALGGALSATGFLTATTCTPFNQAGVIDGGTGCGSRPNRSTTRQFSLAWTGAATLRADVPATSGNVSAFGALHLRAATNFDHPLNAGSKEQDFDITLTDANGASATVNAAPLSAALEPAAGTTSRELVLNDVRVPLSSFTGVDLANVRRLTLTFGGRTRTGSIQLADVAFQA